MTACPASESLALLLQEELLPPLREQVESHVEGCSACQAELERLANQATPLAIAHPGRAVAPGGFVASDSFLARIGARAAFPRPPAASGAGWPKIEGYEILGELGSGGMGRVYRARHLKLGRRVALKVIKHGPDSDQLHVRLGQEALALARLRHPNIVQVYDVGESDGLAYLALELVEGTTLSAWLNGLPQPPDIAAHLARVLAQGVDYAHRNGILHRDLKPANVLVESPADGQEAVAEGPPPRIKIADFGLAKAIAEGDPLGGAHTTTGVLIGTPQYMAPEQGSGLRGPVGPGADIYALGVILYELLAGRPPFRGETPLKTILQVVHEEPPSLSRFCPRIPVDLATICMKCLEKSPPRRYASAGALAEDLRRFLAREPIAARPVGPAGRLARWGQRKPRIAAAAGAAIAGTALAFVLVFWQWRSAEASRAEAVELAASEAAATAEARGERDKAAQAHRESERFASELLLDESIAACERGETEAGLHGLNAALGRAEGAGLREIAHACRANIACWARQQSTVSQSPSLGSSALSVAFSPDGRRLVASQWENARMKAGAGAAQLWDPEGWKRIGQPLRHEETIVFVAFSPDGRHVLTGDKGGSVRLWDAATGNPAGPLLRSLSNISAVAFHPDGRRFAAGGVSLAPGGRGEACVWEVGKEDGPVATYSLAGRVNAISFSPDGGVLATASSVPETASDSATAEVCQWELVTGKRAGPRLIHGAGIGTIAFRPGGRMLATGGDDRIVTLWDRSTGKRIGRPFPHPVRITAVAFSADGRTLAIGGGEIEPSSSPRTGGSLRLWEVDSGAVVASPPSYPDVICGMSLADNARRIATACRDGVIRIVEFNPIPRAERSLPSRCTALAFSPDGERLIAAGGRDGATGGWSQVLDPATGEPIRPAAEHPARVSAIAVPRGSDAYALASDDGAVRAFDFGTDRPIGPPLLFAGGVEHLSSSRDGGLLLATSPWAMSRLWNWRTGEIAWASSPADMPHATALSPDGQFLLTNRKNQGLYRWHIGAQAPERDLWSGPGTRFVSADFSPDGHLALAGNDNRAVRCWELATGRLMEAPLTQDVVWRVGFMGNGTTAYAVAGYGVPSKGYVYLWDPLSGRPPKQLPYRVNVRAVALDADRRFIASGGWAGGVRLWDGFTGRQIGPELPGAGNIVAIACSPDGRTVAAADEHNNLSIWRIPLPGPASSP